MEDAIEEPFKLSIDSIQGRWMCEELGAALTVSGQTVQYLSGECYPIEIADGGKLEIFGYRAIEKKSDASSVVWKNKETGQYLTWMYEGDSADQGEPEVDASLIIHHSGGRSSRKRKVDYAALDKELDKEQGGASGTSKKSVWESQYAAIKSGSSGPSEEAIEAAFKGLKRKFQTWVMSTDQERFKSILAKRGYLSTELSHGSLSADVEAARRLVNYVKSVGAKGMMSQSGTGVNVRIPDSNWSSVFQQCKPAGDDLVTEVEGIRDAIARIGGKESLSEADSSELINWLDKLEKLPVDVELLKITKIGVEINKVSKTFQRAKRTLDHLKSIYLDSKKINS